MKDGLNGVWKMTIDEAKKFCRKAHKGQWRKGSTFLNRIPYEKHPMRVFDLVKKWGGTKEQQMAALLHDTVEDAGIKFSEIEKQFGYEVAHLVAALSEDKSLPTWKDRKLDYLEKISAPENKLAVLVSLADKMDNLGDTYKEWLFKGDEVFEKFNAPKEEQAWFYRELVNGPYERMLRYLAVTESTRDMARRMEEQLSAMGM